MIYTRSALDRNLDLPLAYYLVVCLMLGKASLGQLKAWFMLSSHISDIKHL